MLIPFLIQLKLKAELENNFRLRLTLLFEAHSTHSSLQVCPHKLRSCPRTNRAVYLCCIKTRLLFFAH